MNITDAIYLHARERPDHPAVEDGGRVISYAALAGMIDRAVSSLHDRGVRLSDIVVVALPDTAEHVVALFALARLGAVGLSIAEGSPDSENSKAIEGLAIRAAIVSRGARPFLDVDSLAVDEIVGDGAVAELPADIAAVGADRPVALIQSSGTTGEPKRLFVTHRQLVERNRPRLAHHNLSAAERFLQVPHLRFSWGRDGTIVVMMAGGTVVLNHARGVDDYLRYFSERGITYVTLTPYHLRLILAQVGSDEPLWPELKMVVASSPLTAEERALARRRLTPKFTELYGSNEVSTLTLAYPDDLDRHPDSIGRLVAGIEAQIVDANDAPVPHGQIGEIGFRGPSYFPREYFRNPEATARQFRGGWFYPGDLATMNDEGYIFLKGRTDDVINNAGAKYLPLEVETVLLSHPAVVDAAVIGGPHPQYGEVSVAYVIRSAALTPNELFRFCEGRIAMYKAPQWVFFLDELPRVATGKADRKKLRDMFRTYLAAKRR